MNKRFPPNIIVSLAALMLATFDGSSQNTFPGSGNVGIGTTSPSSPLEVYGAEGYFKATFRGPDGYIQIGPANSGWAHIYSDRSGFIFNQSVWSFPGVFSSFSTSDLSLQTNGYTRLTALNSNGNIGIGTITPEAKLTVSQIGNGWNDGLRINRDASNYLTLTEDGTDIRLKNWGNGGIKFFTSSTEAFTITNSGSIGLGTTTPRAKLEVVGPATGTGPALLASGGGDVVLNPGGSLFMDGNYSYVSGNYIRPAGGSNTQGFFTAGQERLRIAADGKIGIGTNTPSDQVEIVSSNKKIGFNTPIAGVTNGGTLSLSRSDGVKNLYLGSSNSPQDDPIIFGMGDATEVRLVSAGGSSQGFGFYTNTSLSVAFGARALMPAPVMKITGDGKIGIGTISPDQKLTVKGKIHAEEVIIDLSVPAPDYVFEKSYDLKSLEEVKKYIEANKHLPEVPSAKEMEQNGVKIGEMEMILLKKIEELHLHLIAKEEQLKKLEKRIERLETINK